MATTYRTLCGCLTFEAPDFVSFRAWNEAGEELRDDELVVAWQAAQDEAWAAWAAECDAHSAQTGHWA